MNYRGYSITNFDKQGDWEAFSLKDSSEPMLTAKSEVDLKKQIDKKLIR